MSMRREQGRFQRAGLLAAVGLFSLVCMQFGPLSRGDVSEAAVPAVVGSGYLLGPGDAVQIRLHQQPELTIEVHIGATGWVSHPAFGAVEIGGMTVEVAEAVIAAGLRARAAPGMPSVSLLLINTAEGKTSALGRKRHDAAHSPSKDQRVAAIPSRTEAAAELQSMDQGPIIGDPERNPQRSRALSTLPQRRL